MTVCGVFHREDSLGQYWPWLTLNWSPASETGVLAVNVPRSDVKPEFWDPPNPYPFKVLINTNGGARLITVPPFPKLSEHDISLMHAILATEKLIVCKNWSIITWAKNYHPEWVIDPPPERQVVHHLWNVSAVNTVPGAIVRISDQRGTLMATARAGADKFAHATVVIQGAAERHDVIISVEPPVGAQGTAGARQGERTVSQAGRLAIRQTLITQESVIEFSAAVRYVSGGLLQGKPSLFCVTERGLRVFDVEHPRQPRLSWMQSERGMAGAAGWEDGFITWGEHGAKFHALRDPLEGSLTKAVVNSPVIAAEVHRGMLYLLSRNALLALNRQFEVEASVPVETVTGMVRVGDSYVLASSNGIVRVDAREPRAPRGAGRITLPGVARLRDPSVLGNVRDAVYVEFDDRQGRVVGLDAGGPLSAVVTYETLPWIMHAVRVRTTLAAVTEDQTSVAVFHIAGQRELIEREILAEQPV